MFTGMHIRAWISNYRQSIHERVDELTQLDAAIGDGDFGISLQRGLDAVSVELNKITSDSMGELLGVTGKTLISAMGGSSGPLLGSFFLKTGMQLKDSIQCDLLSFAGGIQAGTRGVMALSGADIGNKTMLDALIPATSALEVAAQEHMKTKVAIHKAAHAAHIGSEFTRYLESGIGRSHLIRGKGRGHIDPGAKGIAIMFDALDSVNINVK